MSLKLVFVRCGVFTARTGALQLQVAVLLGLVAPQRAFSDGGVAAF